VRLLADIRETYEIAETDRFSSEDLVQKLAEIETSPWGEWKNGKPMTQRGLAAQLKPFRVFPQKVRLDAYTTKNGYLRESFVPLWERYVPDRNGHCSGSKSAVSTNVYAACSGVPDKKGGTRTPPPKTLPSCPQCGSFYLLRDGTCVTCADPKGIANA
jgi:hypothetical protein